MLLGWVMLAPRRGVWARSLLVVTGPGVTPGPWSLNHYVQLVPVQFFLDSTTPPASMTSHGCGPAP